MTTRFVITAVGDDRPGIVAAFTGALLPIHANLEDSAMTLLEGQFAIVLVVAAAGVDSAAVRAALAPTATSLGLTIDVRSLDSRNYQPTGRECTLTVYGADRPGFVHRITSVLAERQVNIVDLTTRVIGRDAAAPVYAMLLDLRVPDNLDETTLRAALDEVARELGVDCTLRAVDVDIL